MESAGRCLSFFDRLDDASVQSSRDANSGTDDV